MCRLSVRCRRCGKSYRFIVEWEKVAPELVMHRFDSDYAGMLAFNKADGEVVKFKRADLPSYGFIQRVILNSLIPMKLSDRHGVDDPHCSSSCRAVHLNRELAMKLSAL
jgi:hypothetical protein